MVDRAARRWAQLRQAWLALPEGDHQAAAEQLAQLTALREPHADDADVDIALAIAAELAEGVRYACRWYEAVRTADPSQAQYRDATTARVTTAVARDHLAIRSAGRPHRRDCADHRRPLAARGYLGASAHRASAVAAVPEVGDPMRLSDRGLQAWRASLLPDETYADAETVPASVAFVAVLIDGLEAPQVGSGSVSR